MHSTHDQGLMFAKMVDSNIDISQAIKMLESWCVNVTTLTIHKHWKHVGMIFGGPLTLGTTDTSSIITPYVATTSHGEVRDTLLC